MKTGKARFGCRIFHNSTESISQLVRRAQFCEKQGFDSVFVDDHLLYGTREASAPDAFSVLALLASHTRKIRLGIAVTDLVRRHPAIVAQTIGTLNPNVRRRVFLGLGAGDPMNQAPFGFPTDHRFTRLKEGLKILKLLWESSFDNPKTFSGRFYNLKNAYLQTGNPVEPKPPIYLAALGPKMLRLTGEDGDGCVPHCHTPKTYGTDLSIIRDSARKKGRTLDGFHSAYYTLASVSSDSEDADRKVLGPAKYFLALNPEALDKIDPGAKHPGRVWEKSPDPRVQRETIRKIASRIPEKDAFDTVLHGSAEDSIRQIEAYQAAGCQEFMLTFVTEGGLWSSEKLLEQIRYFRKKVVSYFL
ncbi:MAG TPA: LLM class flavin-dependent oxidoreductase [Candidatus Bathyarchaeia archaeon]|nr:LLM class flavin-dependent oxidoreductase [Candidatus Bathyarchaeia archaeon]